MPILALITSVVSLFASGYLYFVSPILGSSVLQTALTDTIGTFRTNVNSSLVDLDHDKVESIGGTTASSVTVTAGAGVQITSSTSNLTFVNGGVQSLSVGSNMTITSATGTPTLNAKQALLTTTTCAVGQHLYSVSSTGAFYCSADTSATNYWKEAGNIVSPSSSAYTFVLSTTTLVATSTLTVNGAANFTGAVNLSGSATGTALYGAIGWAKIGETIATVNVDPFTVSFPARKNIRVYLNASSTGTNPYMYFNGNQAANYAYVSSTNGAAGTSVSGQTNIPLLFTVTNQYQATIDITSPSGSRGKIFSFSLVFPEGLQGASVPVMVDYGGGWANSSQITSISISTNVGQVASSSYMTVYGSND